MTDESLLDELRQAATPAPPAGFKPGMTFQGRTPSEIITPPLPQMETEEEFEQAVRDLGYPLPQGYSLMLVEMQLVQHEAFWMRDPEDKGLPDTAYTAPSNSFRYRFKVVPKSARKDEDIAALEKQARKKKPAKPAPRGDGKTSKVINLADFQVGKTDAAGGTVEMLERSERALAHVVADIKANPVTEIILIDVGDSTEGFESSPNAPQTNDLDLTEQIRVWRRIFWRWIDALAPLVSHMKTISVPSNHCRVRKGKNAQGKPNDDWGIEVLAQVSDIAAVSDAYDHVEFIIPEEYEEHVLVTLAGGKVLGAAHGHQKGNPDQLPGWIKSTGRAGLAQADIVDVGHFHHLRVIAFGDRQWLMVCPSNDNGSSWFTPSSGEKSDPAILTYRVDDRGWYDLDPIWL